ncbi:MAG: T9SS type A sorting domain-containing protein [Candidatus Poribacteria bacterium]
MKKVCYQCHSRQWADNYLEEFDTVVKDYNMLWEYTDNLLNQAYEEELISKDNPLDETPEIMHYLVWHHDGRRWRMGASMMGPDWTHWNGAVDAIMNKLGTMVNDIETRRKFKALEAKIEMLPGTAEGKVTLAINKGLNMISLPLKPETPYTALTFAEQLGATTVIKLDESRQRFVGFTIAQGTDGFPIESGKGYIVNVPQAKKVVFTGTMWTDEELSAAPGIEENSSVWAFVVSGSLTNASEYDTAETLTIWVKNSRTGMIAKDVISPEENGGFAIVLADLNLNPVVNLGDELEIFATNTRDEVVSSQPSYHIQPEDLRRAYMHRIFDLSLRIPKANALWQNYPNPFNPETWIPFQLSESADVKINIYDTSGKIIKTINLGHRQAGIYLDRNAAAFWNGRTETGEQAASGIYFYKIEADKFTQTRKMILVK